MDNRCVVVCDSGAGGVSVLQNLRQKFRCENFVYIADKVNMPYGNKSNEQMLSVADGVIKRALSFAPKLIVAACNTLSVALCKLNADYGVKIIKTLPEVGNGKGYLFCTRCTAESDYVKKIAVGEIHAVKLKTLASEIEKEVRMRDKPTIGAESRKIIEKLEKNVDFISLGCTHYSLVADEFAEIFPTAEILDGTVETIKKSCDFLSRNIANRNVGAVYICDEQLKNAFCEYSE